MAALKTCILDKSLVRLGVLPCIYSYIVGDTCVVVELKKSELVPENRQSLYQEIIACVKEPIIQYAGTSALPKFVLVR